MSNQTQAQGRMDSLPGGLLGQYQANTWWMFPWCTLYRPFEEKTIRNRDIATRMPAWRVTF